MEKQDSRGTLPIIDHFFTLETVRKGSDVDVNYAAHGAEK